MARLADLLTEQGAQVRRDGGVGLAVSGIGRAEIGELAYRHGILLHELADRVVEQPVTRVTLPTAAGWSGGRQPQPPHFQLQPPVHPDRHCPPLPPTALIGHPAGPSTPPEAVTVLQPLFRDDVRNDYQDEFRNDFQNNFQNDFRQEFCEEPPTTPDLRSE
jgi:hypothetical protein